MSISSEISILDVTVRDGSYTIDYQYTPDQVARIARALDAAGVNYIEVSHGCGIGASENLGLSAAASDADYVKAAKGVSKRAAIGVIGGGRPVTFEKDINSIIEDVDFIRFAANCDDPRNVEENIAHARKIRPDIAIFMQLMRSTRRPKSVIVDSAKVAEDMGADIIYIVDTAGHFLPEEVTDLVSELTSSVKVDIGFHGHNNLGLANANSLAAVRAGATSVDASLRGMGRAGGNAQMESLVSLLKREGFAADVDLDTLIEAGTEIVEPIMKPAKGIDALDVITADANIDLYPVDFYRRIAETAGIPFREFIRAIGSNDTSVEVDLDGIAKTLEKLGADANATFEELGFDSIER